VTMLVSSSNVEQRLETLVAAASEPQLNVRVAALGALASYCGTVEKLPEIRHLELMSKTFLKSIDDHDRVSANAVRGLGSVICHLSRGDSSASSQTLLITDLLLKLKKEIESNTRGTSATAQKCLWNACAAVSRVAEKCNSSVLNSYVKYMRSISRRLVRICKENENYKVRAAAVDAIMSFICRGENILDSQEMRLMYSSFLDIYLSEELRSGSDRLVTSLRAVLCSLVRILNVSEKDVGNGSMHNHKRDRLILEILSDVKKEDPSTVDSSIEKGDDDDDDGAIA
jgi:hypothetical protein